MRRKNHEHYDSRINQTAVDLFRLGKKMLAQGVTDTSTEFYEVSRGLHRALVLRLWMPSPFDFELYAMMEPSRFPPHAAFGVVQELHRRLVAAA